MAQIPLISVIIPIYNVEDYLIHCIQSVLDQDYDNIEIFLVDDGSTDKSGEICDNFATKDSRVKVIHQKNAGQSAARNNAIKLSQGDYIAFIDGDDYWDSDCLSFLFSLLKNNNAQLSVCAVRHIGFPLQKDKEILNDDIRCFSGIETAENFLLSKNGFTAAAHHCLIQGDICRKHLFVEGVIYEDLEYMTNLSFDIEKSVSSRCRKYNYVYRSNNSSSANTAQREKDLRLIIDKIRNLILNKAPEMEEYVNKRYIFNSLSHLQSLRKKNDKKLFSEIRNYILKFSINGKLPSKSYTLLYKALRIGRIPFKLCDSLIIFLKKVRFILK